MNIKSSGYGCTGVFETSQIGVGKDVYVIYTILFILLFILFSPVLLYKMIWKGKYREGFKERLGFYQLKKEDTLRIWVHAVSVGETVAAAPLVEELKSTYPNSQLFFSTVTDTGQRMAKRRITKADVFLYFPLDLPCIVKRTVKAIKPHLLLLTETELWPNLIKEAASQGVKMGLINGRISHKSAQSYRYLGPLFLDMVGKIHLFCMQSRKDVEYITSLGADPKRVFYTGNTKYDEEIIGSHEKVLLEKEALGLPLHHPIFVVGSTHHPEEEEILEVYQKLKVHYPHLILILAPRHIERVKDLEEMFIKASLDTILWTQVKERKDEPVILVNTIGELGKIYNLATIVFVGGSLTQIGGHNILEPLYYGKSLLFGPYMYNFDEVTSLVLEYQAGIQIKDRFDLYEKASLLLKDEKFREDLQANGERLLAHHKGAARRTREHIERMLLSRET